MITRIEKVDPVFPDAAVIETAGRILLEDGLVAFPTETVYGLGANALSPDAAAKIYAAKGRPSDNPLIVHIASIDALDLIADPIPEEARKLADRYWPGPLTTLFRKKAAVPDTTTGGLPTVAVRMPSHPVAAALIRAGGGYIAAPSANLSGRPSPTKASHVIEDLDGRVDMILDGGEAAVGLESTIVDLTEEVPVILRPGFYSREMLEDVLGEVRIDPGILSPSENVRPKAPGMRYRHYAPRAPLSIFEGDVGTVAAAIEERLAEAARRGEMAGVLCSGETAERYRAHENAYVIAAGSGNDEAEVAHALYGALRQFDEAGADRIFSEAFYGGQLGDAIMNRLLKAAGYTVVRV